MPNLKWLKPDQELYRVWIRKTWKDRNGDMHTEDEALGPHTMVGTLKGLITRDRKNVSRLGTHANVEVLKWEKISGWEEVEVD